MKKIIFVIPNLFGGGAERVVLNLANEIQKKENHETHIITFNEKVEMIIPNNIRVHIVKQPKKNIVTRPFIHRLHAKAIKAYIKNTISDYSLIISNIIEADKVISKTNLTNTYLLIHNVSSDAHLVGRNTRSRLTAIRKFKSIYSHKNLIFVSKKAQKDAHDNFDITPLSSKVIYNAIDINETVELSKANFKTPLAKSYILHVGAFKYVKRHDLLIRAYAKSKISENLILLGKGPLEDNMKALVKDLNIESKVTFWGFEENPFPLIKNSKFLTLSSDSEGLAMVLLEAAALKIPVVSTNCLSEIIKNNQLLSEIGDVDGFKEHLIKASKEPNKYQFSIDEQFTIEYAAKEFLKLIKH